MKPSLIRLATKVTLFTRPKCGLCDGAKTALSTAWDSSTKKFEYVEVDVTKPENGQWFDLYVCNDEIPSEKVLFTNSNCREYSSILHLL